MNISSPKSMFSETKQQITDLEDKSKDPEHRKKVISGFFISRMFVLHQVHGAHTALLCTMSLKCFPPDNRLENARTFMRQTFQ